MMHFIFQGGTQQAKKEKIDKRDLPEYNQFICETCDRGFKEEEKYNIHTSEHVQVSNFRCKKKKKKIFSHIFYIHAQIF